jgi:hypothetical protein
MKLLTTILPSLLVGGLLFGSALTDAQPSPPTPPTAPKPAKPPKPPQPPQVKGQIHIDLGDLDDMIDEQIQNALEAIGDNEEIPEHVREALKQRLDKVRVKAKKRISKINVKDLDDLKVELGGLGEELGQEMEQFGKEMEKWGKDYEKKFEKQGQKLEKQIEKQVEQQLKEQKKLKLKFKQHDPWAGPHDPFDPDPNPGDMDDQRFDSDDVDDAIKDLRDLKLDQKTRSELKRIRDDSDTKVADAKRQLEHAEEKLRGQLENQSSTRADIERAIDEVTRLEGQIRKARIGAWVEARNKLTKADRARVEAAARKPK